MSRGRRAGVTTVDRYDGAIRNLAKLGKTCDAIATFTGAKSHTIRRYCKMHGIQLTRGGRPRKGTNARHQAICDAFGRGKTLQDVGDDFGITRERVRQILVQNGITDRYQWTIKNSGKAEQAKELYALGESWESITALLGASAQALIKAFEKDTETRKTRRINEFWRSVAVTSNPDKCWEWQGGRGPGGHGRTSWLSRRSVGVHVIAFMLANGYRPSKGKWVLHKCDNPPCCNPRHLYEGTAQDNVRDRDRRGRGAHQNGTAGAKLLLDDVQKIRQLLAQGMSQVTVAEMVGVAFNTVNKINTGKMWAKPRGAQKLSLAALRTIYNGLQSNSFTQAHVSRFYGLHPHTVQSIKRGTNWRVKKFLLSTTT